MLRTYQPKKLHRKRSMALEREWLTETATRYCLAAGRREESIFLINGVFFINIG